MVTDTDCKNFLWPQTWVHEPWTIDTGILLTILLGFVLDCILLKMWKKKKNKLRIHVKFIKGSWAAAMVKKIVFFCIVFCKEPTCCSDLLILLCLCGDCWRSGGSCPDYVLWPCCSRIPLLYKPSSLLHLLIQQRQNHPPIPHKFFLEQLSRNPSLIQQFLLQDDTTISSTTQNPQEAPTHKTWAKSFEREKLETRRRPEDDTEFAVDDDMPWRLQRLPWERNQTLN